MVAPVNGPSSMNSTEGSNVEANRSGENRRQEILQKLLLDSVQLRRHGNTLFKDHLYDEAVETYNNAIHVLRKVPIEMATSDLVKTLNNRGRAYVKLDMMARAEVDATEVLSMEYAEKAAMAAALLVRYHARVGLGATEKAVEDLRRSANLNNADAEKLLSALNSNNGKDNSENSSVSDSGNNNVNMAGGKDNGVTPIKLLPGGTIYSSNADGTAGDKRCSGNDLGRDKLAARLSARAGEELAFGGAGNDSSTWGQCPVPEIDIGVDDNRPGVPLEVVATGMNVLEEGRHGVGSGEKIISGCNGEARECFVTKVLELPRRRRMRSESVDDCSGYIVKTSFTAAASPEATVKEEGEGDMVPEPRCNPLLEHAAVKRCLSVAAAADAETHSVVGVMDVGRSCGPVATVGTANVDGNEATVAGQGRSDGSVSLVDLKEGDNRVGKAVDAAAQDCGSGDCSSGGDDSENGGSARAETLVGAGLMTDCVPSPAKQAQDIRWLVAEAKARASEGDVWAVLDRQWWLRWQRFTGCHESDSGWGGNGHGSDGDRRDDEDGNTGGGDTEDDVKGCNENPTKCDGVGSGAQEETGRGLALGVDEEPHAEKGTQESGDKENGEDDRKENEENNGEKVKTEIEENADVGNEVGKEGGNVEVEKLEEKKDNEEKHEEKVEKRDEDLGNNDEKDGKENEGFEKVTKNQEHEENMMRREEKEGSAAAGGDGADLSSGGSGAFPGESCGSTPERGGNCVPESDKKEEKGVTAGGASFEGDGCHASDPGSEKAGDRSKELVPVAAEKEETKKMEGSVGNGDTAVGAPGSAGENRVTVFGEKRGSVRTGKRQKAIKGANSAKAPAPPHPGAIDNSGLVMSADAAGTVLGTGRRLRLRLVRGYHFVLVPQEAWEALHAWYGGGPALPRMLVSVEDGESGLVVYEPQLYPEFSRLDPILFERSRSSLLSAIPSGGQQGGMNLSANNGDARGSLHAHLTNGSPSNPSDPSDASKAAESKVGDGDGDEDSGRSLEAEVEMHPCVSCERPTKYKCNSCIKSANRIFYCSKSCQAAHWRYHKDFCGKNSEAGSALAMRGKAGLNNLGNTCFLNSAVQCLSHVQPLTRHILTNAFLADVNTTNPLGTGGHLVRAYEQVLKDLWFGSGSSVSPIGLKSAIAKFAPQFNGFSQQDCQEVLSFLLDGLHEDLNRVFKKPYLALPVLQLLPSSISLFCRAKPAEWGRYYPLCEAERFLPNRVLQQDGECGRPDDVIAAESWEMFKMRDKSVLVDNLYGQFKSTLECQQCGKLSRKFDEFNVMPVELLDCQPLHVIMDFAPLLKNASGSTTSNEGKSGTPSAAWILGGAGPEGRRQRRIGVLLPRDALIADLKERLATMFSITVDEIIIVVVPETGPAVYHALPNNAEVKPFTKGYEITAHQCIPNQRYALVVNRVFEGGRHLQTFGEGTDTADPLGQWAEGVRLLSKLRFGDREAPLLVSFPENVSCLGLLELVWEHMGDFLLLTKEEFEGLTSHIAKSGLIKVSEAGDHFAPRRAPMDQAQVYRQERADAENGVVRTEIGRYIPPTDRVSAATVLDARDGKRQSLAFLRLEWSGLLLEKMNVGRINEPFGNDNHISLYETTQRANRVSLEDCLEKFSVPETLCEDNYWYCSNCKELRQAVKTIQVWSLPEVLILHFKRFSHVGPHRRKVELFVDFPINGLDMSPYCRGETLEGGRPMSALYDLFAVSNHMGGMGHGHYTAFVRDWEGGGMSSRWHVCDDHECRPLYESRVCTSHAYVLFYRRRPLS